MRPLFTHLHKRGGRNSEGTITIRHRGGGSRAMYRIVDFEQEHQNIPGTVQAIEYDPNRNAFIALVLYQDGKKGYIVACEGLAKGSVILCSEKADIQPGNRMQLKYIPVGTMVYNVELEPGKGGRIVRGAGNAALVLAQEGNFTHLQLPSSEIRKVNDSCYASIGTVSNTEFKDRVLGKAGRSRLKGKRPHVRGTAMNPSDHPHGHGGGRTSRGMKHPKPPWGKNAFGVKTRNHKKWTNKFILQRRQKKNK